VRLYKHRLNLAIDPHLEFSIFQQLPSSAKTSAAGTVGGIRNGEQQLWATTAVREHVFAAKIKKVPGGSWVMAVDPLRCVLLQPRGECSIRVHYRLLCRYVEVAHPKPPFPLADHSSSDHSMSSEYSDDAAEFDGIEESIASASDVYYAEDDFEQDAASPDHSQTAPAAAQLDIDALHLSQESNAQHLQQQQPSACTTVAAVPVQQPARLAAVQQQFEQAKAELQSAATARLTAALAKRKRADARRLQHIQELTEAKQAAAAAQAETTALNAELSVTRVQLQRQTALLATQAQELDETLRLSEKQRDETVSLKRTIRDLQAACAAATSEIDAANSQSAQLQNKKVRVRLELKCICYEVVSNSNWPYAGR
jgi:hypothetical protein